jgi:hypothetical protein
MCPAIVNPASCEIYAGIRFLRPKIHLELCAYYGQIVMSKGIVTQGCRMLKNWRTNVDDEEQCVLPAICSE